MSNRVKIGIILHTLGKQNSAALRYAILKLNALQTFADFEIIYDLPQQNEFLQRARSGKTVPRSEIVQQAAEFERQLLESFGTSAASGQSHARCNRYVAVCDITLDDQYYLIKAARKLRILAVGGWSSRFSPPSLLEFIIYNCVKQAVREAFASPDSHVAARGCLFDFNYDLENTRNGVLVGHICGDCEATLWSGGDARWKEIRQLTGGKWLGDPADPFSAHSELKRLGLTVFQATGVEDSRLRKLMDVIPGKVVEEIVKYGMLAVAIYLGLSAG